jgi:preprotein translocase subunit YajC
MFITPAFAQTAGAGSTTDIISSLVPIAIMFAIFYFLVIRPQQQRQKEHQNQLQGLRRGDMVVTGGGIIGKIIKLPNDGDEIQVEIAEGVRVKVLRATIAQVISRTEPAKADGKADAKAEEAEKSEKSDKA